MSQFTPPAYPASGLKPHRGTAVLVLGILSLVIGCVGWILGIIAWVMAKNDLAEMDAGLMEPAGRGNTQAGKICGTVAVGLHLQHGSVSRLARYRVRHHGRGRHARTPLVAADHRASFSSLPTAARNVSIRLQNANRASRLPVARSS